MRRAAARVQHRLGRRGAFLAVVGLGWVYYGLGVVLAPTRDTVAALAPITHAIPLDALGAVWVACGVLALVSAVAPPGLDRWGFAGVVGPPLMWFGAFAAAWSTGDTGRSWPSGGTWLTWAGVVMIIVGWREPPTLSTGDPDADT